eukprot:Sspe_Gene.17842::Locus_6371_Transcript_1_4_Confidence_0.333_Length_1490::g.17842::m.17842/K07508/ACAA2; acetyl-CoA acyltransferase 2
MPRISGWWLQRLRLLRLVSTPSRSAMLVFGNVAQTAKDAIYLARHIGLKAGCKQDTPALTVNRLCGSGFEAVAQGAKYLALGEADVVLVGGSENMSQAPHCIYGARSGIPLGKFPAAAVDSLWEALTDSYVGLPMGVTAENLATKYNITQAEVDEFSVRSQKLLHEAQQAGRLKDEICPTEVKKGRKSVMFEVDEHGRADTTVESFVKLPKVFTKDGVVHPAAASGICDGAVALVMTTEEYAKKNGLKPLARLVGYGVSGCDPKIMGIGPVPATHQVFSKTGLSLNDMDLVEVNEAFAPQALAVAKELGIPMEKFNTDGGAIAVGHPLGASGARITAHLIYALQQRNGKLGLGSACIGGGQGISVVIQAMNA